MQQICPVSGKQVNEMTSRINSVFTVIILVLFFQYEAIGLVFILGLDFLIRGFFDAKHSIFNLLSSNLIRIMKKQGKMINAGPKIFAAQVGSFFSFAILAFYFLEFVLVADIFAFVLLFFALLEGFFGYCVACKIYPFFRKP